MAEDKDIMKQKEGTIEVGYFQKRKADFNKALEKGLQPFTASSQPKPKKRTKKTTQKAEKKSGKKDTSNMPPALKKYWDDKQGK